MPGALEGIRILDITNYIAGPYASLLLADLGAEVTKIETPGKGDPFRTWDKEPKNYSPSFCALNRNKKSLTLDMKTPEGKEVFLRLARDADVIVENLRPGVVDRLGIGYDVVREMNPRIIYCSISAFGQDGPYRKRPGYDTIGQSLSGLLSVLTELDHPAWPGRGLLRSSRRHLRLLRRAGGAGRPGTHRRRPEGGDLAPGVHHLLPGTRHDAVSLQR